MRSQLAETIQEPETNETECEACAARRELRRLYLEAKGRPGTSDAAAVIFRVRRVLQARCTCRKDEPFDLRAKCRELGCRPRITGIVQ
jgi:hypothetical protein